MPEKHLKKCSPSLVMREMKIKTTLRSHLNNSGDGRLCTDGGERGRLLHY